MNKNKEIEKLKTALISKIKLENDSRYVDLSSDEIMKKVIDSSLKGKYVFWVLREYLKGNIQRFEDMDRVKQSLILFKNNLSKFTDRQKQLNKMSFQELEELVTPYQDVLTQNEIKRMNKEKIYSETRILYDGPEGKILVPLTRESAIFWGQGTKWCTASIKNNMFEHYNKEGLLYIFITNDRDEQGREVKYQLHFESGQFMDSKDQPIDEIPDLFRHKIYQFGIFDKFSIIFSEYMSKTFLSENLSLPTELKSVILKKHLKKTSTFLNNAAYCSSEKQISEINKFPDEEKTSLLALSGNLIKYIENPTEEMCLIAIKQNGNSIQYIKNPTDEMIIEACWNYPAAITLFDNVFEKVRNIFRTKTKSNNYLFKMSAIKKNGLVIEYIKNPTQEMELAACKSNGLAIQYINNPTKEMITEAVKSNGKAIYCVKQTYELCELAVRQNPDVVENLRYTDHTMFLEAVHRKPEILKYIVYRPKEILLEAVKSDWKSLKFFREHEKDEEMIMTAIEQNGLAIQFVDNPTNEMIMKAVKSNGLALKFIKNPTQDITNQAIYQNAFAMEYVDFVDDAMKITALKQNGECIKYIKNPTDEMIMLSFDYYINSSTEVNNINSQRIFKKKMVNEDVFLYVSEGKEIIVDIDKFNFALDFEKNIIKYIKPQKIENIEYIIKKVSDNKILSYYYSEYLKEVKNNYHVQEDKTNKPW